MNFTVNGATRAQGIIATAYYIWMFKPRGATQKTPQGGKPHSGRRSIYAPLDDVQRCLA
jgi:hypothetical protein